MGQYVDGIWMTRQLEGELGFLTVVGRTVISSLEIFLKVGLMKSLVETHSLVVFAAKN